MLRIPTYFTPTTTLKLALTCPSAVLHVHNYSYLLGPEFDLTDLGTITGLTQLLATTLSPHPNTMMCYDAYSAHLAAVSWETSGFCLFPFCSMRSLYIHISMGNSRPSDLFFPSYVLNSSRLSITVATSQPRILFSLAKTVIALLMELTVFTIALFH